MTHFAFRLLPVFLATCCLSVLAFAAQALEVMADTAEPVAEHAEQGGLPQLDVATYPNQLFWLALTGVILYLLMAKIALPRIQRLMVARDEFVHDNLRKAAALRLKTEDAKVSYDLTIRQAEANAKEFLANTVAQMKQKQDLATQDVMKNIAARTQAAEQHVQAEKDKIMATLDHHATRLANDIMLTVFDAKASSV